MDKKIKLTIKTLEDIKKVCKKSSGKLAESLYYKTSNLIKELSSENNESFKSLKDEIIERAGITEENSESKKYSMSDKKEKSYEICETCGNNFKKNEMNSHIKTCNG